MSLARHRTDIETHFMNEMLILHPALVIIGENADTPAANNSEWIRMSITVLSGTHPCLNNEMLQTEAIFNVQVFTPLGKGAGRASTLIDDAWQVLRNSSLTGIEFLEHDVGSGVVESDWFSILLRADYRAFD